MISITKQVFYRGARLMAVQVGQRYQSWWNSEQSPFLIHKMSTSTDFNTADEALTWAVSTTDVMCNGIGRQAPPILKKLKRVGVPKMDAEFLVRPLTHLWMPDEADLAQMDAIWRSAASSSGGQVYRDMPIIVWKCDREWYAAMPGYQKSWTQMKASYPSRARCLLAARRIILEGAVRKEVTTILSNLMKQKTITISEFFSMGFDRTNYSCWRR